MKFKKLLSLTAAICLSFQTFSAVNLSAEEAETDDSFIYGDIDGNGTADITDLSLLSLHLIKDITLEGNALKAADTNGNSEVTLGDLAHFRRFLSKLTSKLGPEEAAALKLKQASDYSEVFSVIEKSYRDYELDYNINYVDRPVAVSPSTAPSTDAPSPDIPQTESGTAGVSKGDYSETYNQEENVLESDIVKTDGNAIFTLSYINRGKVLSLNAVYANDGKFETGLTTKISLKENKFGTPDNVYAEDMYLYNDMLVVLGTTYFTPENTGDGEKYAYSKTFTFAAVYTKGDEQTAPELIDTYYQEGSFRDVRITPDGFMYLVSNGRFANRKTHDESDIPVTGTNESIAPVSSDCIYIPAEADMTCSRSYTAVGSIDLNTSGEIKNSDMKVITGYTGDIYCSEKNLYLTHERYSYPYLDNEKPDYTNWNVTEITRISLSEGKITPEATGEVPGYVHDQFAMSEYNGYFRIVTTADYNISNGKYYDYERSNNVYILDQDLSRTGEITHFAKDESVKSVSFAGDLAYVVTYVQTDPLFAVDLSDPANPVILDEFKIDGFSTYMQKWDENHLLGFGVSTYTNSYGGEVRDGYKLVMFDNSDPENLSAEGIYKMLHNDSEFAAILMQNIPEDKKGDIEYNYLTCSAEYERKALLIAPEKNLIGVPLYYDTLISYNDYLNGMSSCTFSGYIFFSYDNGEFTPKNFLGYDEDMSFDHTLGEFNRAVYIGDYVYIISNSKLMAADIETCTKTDEISIR